MPTGSRSLARAVLLTLVTGGLSVACASTSGIRATPLPFPSAPSAPDAPSPALAPRPSALREPDAVVQAALAYQGVPYRLGGDDPANGFDCSGLVRYVFERYQVDVGRTVAEQFSQGRGVKVDDVQAGDLIFFTTIGPGATHVGIALGIAGPGEFVHAPSDGGVVRVEHFDTPYWRSRIVGVRRMF